MQLWGRSVSMGQRVLGALATFALVIGMSVPANAQSSIAGTVTGQVTDASGAAVPGAAIKLMDVATGAAFASLIAASGAAVPGAAIKLMDVATGAAFASISNDAGRYDFPTVPPGKYDITFTKEG